MCACLSSPVRLVLRAVPVRCCLLSGHRSSLSSACIAAAVTGPIACHRPRRRHFSSLGLPPSLPSAATTADRLTVCRRRQSGVTTWIYRCCCRSLSVWLCVCLSLWLSVCLSLCLCLLYVDRSACSSCSPCLVLLLLPPCNVVCVGGLQPGYHAHGGRGAGSASPPYPSGALQERYARKGGGTRWWVRGRTTTSGLHACTHAPGSAPHCCGSRCTAVGSVAATCRLLASFLSFAAGG